MVLGMKSETSVPEASSSFPKLKGRFVLTAVHYLIGTTGLVERSRRKKELNSISASPQDHISRKLEKHNVLL